MTSQNLLLFIISTFFVSATPGANMLFAFQIGLNYGFKNALYVMAGLSLGLMILLSFALAGLGIIAQYPIILSIIKIIGALYLCYLGILSWNNHAKIEQNQQQSLPSPSQLFKNGIFVSLSNPKAMLFFAAFFPKFIDFTAPLTIQYSILIIVFFIIETFWQFIYAIGGIKLSNWLNTGQRMLWLNRSCGAVFILIALMLIYEIIIV